MKKGFTIIELLVASALLGMLVTILTMVFNQSSIAWRIGIAGVSDLGDVRYTMGCLTDVADNAFVYGIQKGRLGGIWDLQGNLHKRACVTDKVTDNSGEGDSETSTTMKWFFNKVSLNNSTRPQSVPGCNSSISVGSGESGGSFETFTVNVMSGGPANDIDDWQAVWSYPDDPSEW